MIPEQYELERRSTLLLKKSAVVCKKSENENIATLDSVWRHYNAKSKPPDFSLVAKVVHEDREKNLELGG